LRVARRRRAGGVCACGALERPRAARSTRTLGPMQIECSHHIDASDPDDQGMYEYYYEYDLYRFSEGDNCLVARSYYDEPEEAHFLRMEIDGQARLLADSDLKTQLFNDSTKYLRELGKKRLMWLSGQHNGYQPVLSIV
jgi:hypothetical protein